MARGYAAFPPESAVVLNRGATLLGFTPKTLLAFVGVRTPPLMFRDTKLSNAGPSLCRRTM